MEAPLVRPPARTRAPSGSRPFRGHSFSLGRVFGIPIYAHYSWLPVFPFYAWAIASGLLPREAPGLSIVQYWSLGLLTTVLLFVSVLVHELAHATMARAEGLGTGNITLYMFGGLAVPWTAVQGRWRRIVVALAGPFAGFLLCGLVYGSNQLYPWARQNHLLAETFRQPLPHQSRNDVGPLAGSKADD